MNCRFASLYHGTVERSIHIQKMDNILSKPDITMDDIRTNTSDQSASIPKHDLERQIKALDEIIERLEAIARAKRKVRYGWIQERTSWDDLIDVNCTPLGQDLDYGYDGPWDSLFELWDFVGAYLSEAMSLCDNRSE